MPSLADLIASAPDAEMATWLDAATGRGRVSGMSLRADLDLLDSLIRRAASGPPVKHHEVSQALAALERIELALARVPNAGAGGSGWTTGGGGGNGGGQGGSATVANGTGFSTGVDRSGTPFLIGGGGAGAWPGPDKPK